MSKKYKLLKGLPDEIVLKRYLDSGYYVSADGRIFSIQNHKFLKGYRHEKYLWFDLWVSGVKIRKSQHRLIAECYIPNPNNYPLVRHLDDNPYNTSIDNLAWGTKSDNMNDAVKNGLLKSRPSPKGETNWTAKMNEQSIVSLRREYDSGIHYKVLSEKYGISHTTVIKIGQRQCWKHIN